MIFDFPTNFKLGQAILFNLALLVSLPVQAAVNSHHDRILHAEQWDLVRNGENMLQLPVLKTLVNDWSAKPGHKIELRYPGGEEGEIWVRQLMDWLISLGVGSQYLVAVPGSGEADVIRFQIIKAGESYQ